MFPHSLRFVAVAQVHEETLSEFVGILKRRRMPPPGGGIFGGG